jgi:hypothetical protein
MRKSIKFLVSGIVFMFIFLNLNVAIEKNQQIVQVHTQELKAQDREEEIEDHNTDYMRCHSNLCLPGHRISFRIRCYRRITDCQ